MFSMDLFLLGAVTPTGFCLTYFYNVIQCFPKKKQERKRLKAPDREPAFGQLKRAVISSMYDVSL